MSSSEGIDQEKSSLHLCCRGCGVLLTDKKDYDRRLIFKYLDAVLDALQEQSQEWRRNCGTLPRDVKLAKVEELALRPSFDSGNQQFRCVTCFMPEYDNAPVYATEPTRSVLLVHYSPLNDEREKQESLSVQVQPYGSFARPSVYVHSRLIRLAKLYEHSPSLDVQQYFDTICEAINCREVSKQRHWDQGWSSDLYATCCSGLIPLELCERLRQHICELFNCWELDPLTPTEYEEFLFRERGDDDDDDLMKVTPIVPVAANPIAISRVSEQQDVRLVRTLKLTKLSSTALKLKHKIAKRRERLRLDECQLAMFEAELDRRTNE